MLEGLIILLIVALIGGIKIKVYIDKYKNYGGKINVKGKI